MNRKLLALAVGAALALPLSAQAAPTLYGKIDLSLEHLDGDVGVVEISDTTLESNKSRLGVRGEEKLSNDLGLVYQIEYGVSMDGDSANSPDLSQRDRFLGFKHGQLGTLRFGRINTPLKTAEGPVDVFNNSRFDMENVLAGQNRASNSIAYSSPKIADAITVNFTHITEGSSSANYQTDDAGQSMSVVFDKDGLYLALAVDNDVMGTPDDGVLLGGSAYLAIANVLLGATPPIDAVAMDTLRLVGAVDVAGLRLGALYQESDVETVGIPAEQTGLLLSAAYNVQKWTFKAEYAQSEGEAFGLDLGEITQLAVGADYQWTQAFRVYGMLGQYQLDAAGVELADLTLAGVGMALNF